MDTFDIPLTGHGYSDAIDKLRRAVEVNRGDDISVVQVSSGTEDRRLKLFMRHSDLYMIGIDFGAGPYRFRKIEPKDLPGVPATRQLEFTVDYRARGLTKLATPILIDGPALDMAVQLLSTHRTAANGSALSIGHKRALVSLIFVTSEATRFGYIQRDVRDVLRSAHGRLDLHDYIETVTNWRELSAYYGKAGDDLSVLHKSALPPTASRC